MRRSSLEIPMYLLLHFVYYVCPRSPRLRSHHSQLDVLAVRAEETGHLPLFQLRGTEWPEDFALEWSLAFRKRLHVGHGEPVLERSSVDRCCRRRSGDSSWSVGLADHARDGLTRESVHVELAHRRQIGNSGGELSERILGSIAVCQLPSQRRSLPFHGGFPFPLSLDPGLLLASSRLLLGLLA